MPQGPIAGAIVVFNAFGELDREMAERLLSMWRRVGEPDQETHEVVLSFFGAPDQQLAHKRSEVAARWAARDRQGRRLVQAVAGYSR